ncbi:MAG TPA: arylesterase [Cyclobacteriaceae bacterium]|jgi:acyl-CoA thioesterase-1|nr:arylesterase [Cyclobacteriaceae bacterium]
MLVAKKVLFIALVVLIQASSAPKTILFFGDSLTAGYGSSPEEAFPALIEQQFNKSETKVRIVNAGVSGETSAGGLGRIDWILKQPIDIFVLELGANDGLRGLPVEATRQNLQSIIDKVKTKYPKAKIVLTGMMVPPNMGQDYSNKFKNLFPELAKKNNLTLMPFLLDGVAGNPKLNIADGIHPNPQGHKIVAGNLFKILEKLI